MAPKRFSSAEITRLSRASLISALEEWGVAYQATDRDLKLRCKLDEAIHGAGEGQPKQNEQIVPLNSESLSASEC